MSAKKKEIRRAFRLAVFSRDFYHCKMCGAAGEDRQEGYDEGLPPLDAHHITNRDDMPNGGYVMENGITVCPDCHLKAEAEEEGYTPDILYKKIGSSHEKARKASLLLA